MAFSTRRLRMRKPIAPAVLELLLLSRGLIDQARGEKKEALQRAWINAFNHEAAEMLEVDQGRLPQSPRAAIEALMRLAVQMARGDGMSGADLAQFFNDAVDGGALLDRPDPDAAVRPGFALLGVLAAHRLGASLSLEHLKETA